VWQSNRARGKIHSSTTGKALLPRSLDRLQKLCIVVWFRTDATIAKPEIYPGLDGAAQLLRIWVE